MKATLMGFLSLSFLAGMTAAPNGPAETDYKAMFARHWQISKDFTLLVAEAMPAEGYDFKPTAEEMTFGQIMFHLAESNSESFASVAGTKALAKPSGTDKQTVIKFLTDSFDQCAKDWAATTPAQLDKTIDIVDGAGARQTTQLEVILWAFTDTAHHRGQAEVYLRLKNIKPPRYRF